MSRFYAAALSDPPKKATVGMFAQLVVEMEANHRRGILPVDGGWHDQDPDHVMMIRLAGSVRAGREAVQQRKRSRSSRKK